MQHKYEKEKKRTHAEHFNNMTIQWTTYQHAQYWHKNNT